MTKVDSQFFLPYEPRIVFFSGGTALKETARELARHTRNTVHLVTTFDSGGSSAALRHAFAMPAVGDIRARLMALADLSSRGTAEIFTLFSYRLPFDSSDKKLWSELGQLVKGTHPLLCQIPLPGRNTIQENIQWIAAALPLSFPLQGASIGNLLLTARYLQQGRQLLPAIDFYSRMVQARGRVLPIAKACAHLAVRLASGEVLVGQHRFTGKEVAEISSPITEMWLTASEESLTPVDVQAQKEAIAAIGEADCVCYPIGSFYSSVIANLLPKGIGRAVARAGCPKVFIPNLGVDPELAGHTIQLQVERLLRPLLADAPGAKPVDMLDCVLVDKDKGVYAGGLPEKWLSERGICLVHAPLVTNTSAPLAGSRLLSQALLHVAQR